MLELPTTTRPLASPCLLPHVWRCISAFRYGITGSEGKGRREEGVRREEEEGGRIRRCSCKSRPFHRETRGTLRGRSAQAQDAMLPHSICAPQVGTRKTLTKSTCARSVMRACLCQPLPAGHTNALASRCQTKASMANHLTPSLASHRRSRPTRIRHQASTRQWCSSGQRHQPPTSHSSASDKSEACLSI